MSDETVRPALTPEEWRPGAVVQARGADDDLQFRRDVESGEFWVHVNCGDSFAIAEPATLHAVAALALQGQPFGFTWEMVDEIRWCASEYDGEPEHLARLASDIIAALLPPRESV